MERQNSGKDLEGLLVVTVEQAVAAPYTSCRLADAGARVIKVERPEGDFARNYDSNALGNSAYFVWLNSCLLYTSPSPRDMRRSRMPSSA